LVVPESESNGQIEQSLQEISVRIAKSLPPILPARYARDMLIRNAKDETSTRAKLNAQSACCLACLLNLFPWVPPDQQG
jgi:hypothetical protein